GLDLRESQGQRAARANQRQRAETGVPAVGTGSSAGKVRGPRLHSPLPAADGRPSASREHQGRRRILPGASTMEVERADAQGDRPAVGARREKRELGTLWGSAFAPPFPSAARFRYVLPRTSSQLSMTAASDICRNA